MVTAMHPVPLATTFVQLGHFYTAAERQLGRYEAWYRIAGQTLCLRFAGTALVGPVARAFAHLRTGATGTPDLTICLAESASSAVALPAPLLADGYYYEGSSSRYCAQYANGSWVETLDQPARLGFLAIDAALHYPAYAHAAPLRNLLTWWFAEQGYYGLHAAAIGTPEGAILLIGNGGAGKSTTAVTALLQGLPYLGDDFCLLAPHDVPQVHSLYSSGKLCADSQQWLSPPAATATAYYAEGKLVYQWHPHFAAQLGSALPIRALVLPEVSGGPTSWIGPAPRSTAFSTLVTTALRVSAWRGALPHGLLTAAKQLVGQLPAYRLTLGEDRARLPALLTALVMGAEEGHA